MPTGRPVLVPLLILFAILGIGGSAGVIFQPELESNGAAKVAAESPAEARRAKARLAVEEAARARDAKKAAAEAAALAATKGDKPTTAKLDVAVVGAADAVRAKGRVANDSVAVVAGRAPVAAPAGKAGGASAAPAKAGPSGVGGRAAQPAAEPGKTPGLLTITLTNGETGKPAQGAWVYAPLPGPRLEIAGTTAVVPPEFSGGRKQAGESGVVSFTSAELTKVIEAAASKPGAWLLLVSATNMVPVTARLNVGAIASSGAALSFVLRPAVLVAGKVSATDAPFVANASVTVRQAVGDEKPADAFETKTNGQGEFSFATAKEYKYQLSVRADGYVTQDTKVFDFARDERTVTVVLKPGRVIEGVVESGGAGLAGVRVHSETGGVETVSESSGRFVLSGLPDLISSNRARIRFTKAGYSPLVTFALVNDKQLRAEMAVAASMKGSVIHAEKPFAGATVAVSLRQEDKDYKLASVKSDKAGNFVVPDLGEGTVIISASTASGLYSAEQRIGIRAAEQREGVVLELFEGATVKGSVIAKQPDGSRKGIAGVQVSMDGKKKATSGGDGAFTLSGISDGEHTFGVINAGTLPPEMKGLELFTVDGKNFYVLPQPRRMTTHLGTQYELTIEVTPYFSREVRRVDLLLLLDSPASLDKVKVSVTPTIAIGADGTKAGKIEEEVNMVGGSGSVRLLLVEGVEYSAKITHSRIFEKLVEPAQFKGVPHEGALSVNLVSAMLLSGYVKDSSGNAVVDADARAYLDGQSFSARTNQHGFFEVTGLSPKKYRLTVFRQSFYQYAADHVAETTTPEPLQITLLKANEIRITVTDAGGTPQPGTAVRIARPASGSATSVMEYFELGETDAEGRKIVNFHWVRHYQIIVWRGEALVGGANFDNVKDIPNREVTMVLVAAMRVSGTVVSSTSGQRVSVADVAAKWQDGSVTNSFWGRANTEGDFNLLAPAGTLQLVTRENRAYKAAAAQSTIGGAGHLVRVDPKDRVEGNWAEFLSVSAPSRVTAGESFTVFITVLNRGSTTWSAATNYRCGSQSPQDNGRWGVGRLMLADGVSVGPGGTATFSATLKAPSNGNGSAQAMQWRMLREGYEWFGEFSALSSVIVDAPPPPQQPGK